MSITSNLSSQYSRVGTLIFFLSLSFSLTAQTPACGFDELAHQMRQSVPGFQAQEDEVNDDARNYVNQANQPDLGVVYYIPTVVHIIHDTMDITPGDPTNPTDSAVYALVDNLNDGFRNVGLWDSTTGVNVEIQFCLASQDTNGIYTNGITRDPGYNLLYGQNFGSYWPTRYWNTNNYCNIYMIKSAFISGASRAGFSSFPNQHGNPQDGFAVSFYSNQFPSTTVWMHEAGHYLGLYHTFTGGCANQDCQVDGDRVCDTPPDGSQTNPASCSDSVNTCTTDTVDTSLNNPFRSIALGGLGDQNDPISNYMDYTPSLCRNDFTQGQKDRMRGILTTTKSSLLTSPGCQVVCSLPPSSFFTLVSDTVESGDTVYFNHASNNSNWYQWTVDGQPYSNASDTLQEFLQKGRHVITLCVANDSILCDTLCFSRDIYVTCAVQSDFTLSQTDVGVGVPVTMTQMSQGAASFTWKIDNTIQSNLTSHTQTFSRPGIYDAQLISANGFCPDTSVIQRISVGHCWKYLTDHWVMGVNAGIDFSQGAAVSAPVSGYSAASGSAAVSDAQGNLMFYSNGLDVYNSAQNLMVNGDSIDDPGFSPQQVQILPVPGDSSLHYVFTTRASATNTGIRYALVDMRADSGRGAVVLKQQILSNFRFSALETTRHANGSDFWLLARKYSTNEIHTFHIDQNGINSPIVNTIGATYGGNGQLHVSPDQQRVALSRISDIYLADFDNSTGAINNDFAFTTSTPFHRGIAFSPNSEMMYVTMTSNSTTNDKVGQFDLSGGNATAIEASEFVVGTTLSQYASMYLGADGKVYIAPGFGSNMHRVNAPNQQGFGCKYQVYAVSTSPGYLTSEACETPPGFGHRTELPLTGPSLVCANAQDVRFRIADSDSTVWTYLGAGQIDSASTGAVYIDFGAAGTDTLIVWSRLACVDDLSDTLLIQVNNGLPLSIGPDSTLCPGDSLILSIGNGFGQVFWQDSTMLNSLVADSPGLYWIAATDSLGCSSRDSMTLAYVSNLPPPVNLGNDTLLCPGISITLDAGPNYATYNWQNASSNSTFTANAAGVYHVTAVDACSNVSQDTILLTFQPLPLVNLGADTTICPGSSLILDAGSGFDSYLWQNSASTQTLSASSAGTYSVVVTDQCNNTASDSLVLAIQALPQINLGVDTTLCQGSSLNLNAGAGFSSYLWQNSSTSATLNANQAGTYSVVVTDYCSNSVTDSLTLAYIPLPQLNLGADTVLCPGQSFNLQAAAGFTNYLWWDNSSGMSFMVNGPGTYWLEVTDSCGFTVRDSLVVAPDAPQGVNLGADTALCSGQSLLLQAGGGFINYLWQGGSMDSTLLITGPGSYWVQVTNAAGCLYTDSIAVTLCVGLTSGPGELAIQVYPNPNQGQFVLSVNGLLAGTSLDLRIFNALGQEVRRWSDVADAPQLRWPLDAGGLAAGHYLLQLRVDDEQIYHLRMVVE